MNENEKTERARIKEIHKKLREPLRGGKSGDRYDFLAWAFVRGFKFRRCERSHHMQTLDNGNTFEHNMPYVNSLWGKLVRAGVFSCDKPIPNESWKLANLYDPKSTDGAALRAWLADPTGAIAAPAPKPKKPYAPVAA